MNRRTILKTLALPVAAASGLLGWMTVARARNRYYEGPVTDHFDGVRFFSPVQPQDKGLLELARWQLEQAYRFRYMVRNDEVERATEALAAIVERELELAGAGTMTGR